MQAFGPLYLEAMSGAIDRSGIRNSWFALNLARGADSEPFSAQRYHETYPYGALLRQVSIRPVTVFFFSVLTINSSHEIADKTEN